MKRLPAVLTGLAIIGLLTGGGFYYKSVQTAKALQAQQVAQVKAEADRQARAAAIPPIFNKQLFSVDAPDSIWVVANKQRPLQPKEFIPNDLVTPAIPLRSSPGSPEMKLRREAALALEAMGAAGKLAGVNIMLASAYRSYTTQSAIYDREVATYGQTVADTQSARPGFSEHQTGLAADLEPTSRQCEIADCFADTAEGKWLAANAPTYGYILRYTADKTAVTGYKAESWHYRYVGKTLTAELQKQGIITLEEFFNLPAAASY